MLQIDDVATQNTKCEASRRRLWHYCKIKSPDFYDNNAEYLKEICYAIQEFENDDNELLVINLPPRHGKSRTAINAEQWLLGRNPKYKIITGSYNETLAIKFSKRVRDGINEIQRSDKIVFKDVFPGVIIKQGSSSMQLWTIAGNEEENYLATSPGGTTTGFGADFIFIDDVIKNAYEASNNTILDNIYDWFTDTLYSRLEGKRKIVLIMTRWSTKDLAGRLIDLFQSQGRKHRIISKKACDNGKMLNDAILNLVQYNNLKQTIGEEIVKANYDQEPIDIKGQLYKSLQTYDNAPQFKAIKGECDTADEGDNYLCNIIYGVSMDNKAYILDVYYTQDDMAVTEREVAKRLTEYRVSVYTPESNNGGRGFSRAVERIAREIGNNTTSFKPYHQTLNKEARILSNATAVELNVYFPKNWKTQYPIFYKHITEYQRIGKNKYDDAADALTAIVEKLIKRGWEFL